MCDPFITDSPLIDVLFFSKACLKTVPPPNTCEKTPVLLIFVHVPENSSALNALLKKKCHRLLLRVPVVCKIVFVRPSLRRNLRRLASFVILCLSSCSENLCVQCKLSKEFVFIKRKDRSESRAASGIYRKFRCMYWWKLSWYFSRGKILKIYLKKSSSNSPSAPCVCEE